MILDPTKQKDKINVLLNIDNFFGKYTGRMGPMLTFLFVAAIPFIIYVMLLSLIVPLWLALVVEVLWAARMALLILGKEPEKLVSYKNNLKDNYSSISELVRTPYIHDDGLIEYLSGKVAYIISGYTASYYEDADFHEDMEKFLVLLRGYEYDLHLHNCVDEFRLEDDLTGLSHYTDDVVRKERMMFYIAQDEYTKNGTKMFKYNFLVKASKYNWKILRRQLDSVVTSSDAKVFRDIVICNKVEASNVFSRDICAYIDLAALLQGKYTNSEFFGSEVLFYGDNIPEEYKAEEEKSGITDGRVTEE